MEKAVRFVHAADLHLDAPFKGVDATDPRVKDALVASTYAALDALVEACIANQVDFLVIAGDVYNAGDAFLRAQFAFRDACARLDQAGIAVYVARGNHDPLAGRTSELLLPPNVHVFSGDGVERVVFENAAGARCALYGRSFRTAAETANLAAGFRCDPDDRPAIGVLHANVGGRTDYEPYAPCSLEDLRAAKMDYWALGHIHKPEVLGADPEIAYSGCTQGLTPNESGLRGCRVVTLGRDGVASEFVPTSSVVWERAVVDTADVETVDDLLASLESAVDASSRSADGRPVVLRAELDGRSAVHAPLTRPGALRDVLADVRARGLERDPWVWVDRVRDSTRPMLDLGSLRDDEQITGDLVRLADALLADEDALAGFIAEATGPVLSALDARDVPAVDARDVLERARDLALDRLLAGEDR